MPAKPRGESKVGLVVTLVFFILATLALGLGTYYGFADQDALKKQAADEKQKATTMTKERDWYKFQADLYRAYLGQLPADRFEKLGVNKSNIDTLGAAQTDKDEVKAVVALLDKPDKFGWNKDRPRQTVEEKLAQKDRQIKDLEQTNQGLKTSLATAETRAKESDEQLKQEKQNFDTTLAKFKKEANTDLEKQQTTFNDLKDQNARVEKERDAATQQLNDEKNKFQAALRAKEKSLGEQQKLIGQQKKDLDQLRQKDVDVPPNWRTDWRIVEMDRRGTMPYINLGSADHVQPQLTFSIHSLGLDGKPNPKAKGTLEVVKVIDRHLSQARVTSVVDRNADPILKGDILFNPSWDPTLKKHVAFVGIIDLTGDGRDSSREFRRNLERNNIVVDAYMDMQDKELPIKGPGMTVQTDFLILGDASPQVGGGRDRDPARTKKIVQEMEKMVKDARDHGVRVLGLRKYLDLIGYKLPHGSAEAERSSAVGTKSPISAPARDRR